MNNYQQQFIQLALDYNALKFGEFTLKSGRISPYFYNSGLFSDGLSLARLGELYAKAIISNQLEFDMIFGPAYKGIPLVSSTAVALAKQFDKNVPYAFNRKEKKDHGEGGVVVGKPLQGNVLIIDDVITAGTAIRESIDIIQAHNANLCGIVISLDRQEVGQNKKSAIQEIADTFHIPVISIAKLEDIFDFIKQHDEFGPYLEKLLAYRKKYGV